MDTDIAQMINEGMKKLNGERLVKASKEMEAQVKLDAA
jgi:hypothetical protein